MVVYSYIYIYILYGGGGPPGPKNARADFCPSPALTAINIKRSQTLKEQFTNFF